MLLKDPQTADCLVLQKTSGSQHILWELESACPLRCKYCYPSRTRSGRLSPERVEELIGMLKQSPIEYIHLTGGEPTLSPYLESIVRELQDKKLLITTNLAQKEELLEGLMERYKIYSVGVSLDSVDPGVNDRLRGQTEAVMGNLRRLLRFRDKHGISTKIRIHCVISKVNLEGIPALLKWAKAAGIDEVSCQPVSMEAEHPDCQALGLGPEDLEGIERVLEEEQSIFRSSYGESHAKLMRYYLRHPNCHIPGRHELCEPFIDASGRLYNCPRKVYTLRDLSHKITAADCVITPQCMTCLKHLKITEDGHDHRND